MSDTIKEINLTQSLESNFARYAGMVIQDRAIVDVRDGLKPAARQLTYAQYVEGLTYNKPFKKATKSVAAGMSHFYVHGDASAYSTLIRMGKPFAVRYPLEAVQGSYGNQMENDNEAASRYVEMKLSELGTHLFDSIDKEVLEKDDWRENYDGTEYYPSVLPSIGFYNLVQGSTGIGVALASSIPQFNLKEMNAGLVKLLWNSDIDFNEIYCAPDFATGGTIINGDEVKESIRNGIGPAIKIRAKLENDYENNQIIVTELPYGVYTNTICQQLSTAIEENPGCGIVKFLDLTGLTPLIKISLEKGANFGKVKEFLYKNTSLQAYFSVNMVMLKDGKVPQIFGLKEAMLEYLAHSKKILRNQIKFDLNKAKDRLEIVEGYLKALSIINEIVDLIKHQDNAAKACLELINVYGFSEKQAKAILDLKLNRLVNMEIAKIQKERDELLEKIERYNLLLSDENEFLKVIEKNLLDISNKFGDNRRTVIENLSEDAPIIEEKAIIVYISNSGAMVAKQLDSLSSQKRGGVGLKVKFTNKSDHVWKTIIGKTTDKVILFTSKGQSYALQLSNISLTEETYLSQFLGLRENEYVTNILTFDKAKEYKYVIFATKNGLIKKTNLEEYLGTSRKTGVIAIKLNDDDELVSTKLIENDTDNIFIATRNGMSLLFSQTEVSASGRNTIGVKSIGLKDNDYVVAMDICTDKTKEVLTICTDGASKRTSLDEFNIGTRTNKGIKICAFKEDNVKLTDAILLTEKINEVIINTSNSSLRTSIENFPILSRAAVGVNAIKLADGAKIKNIEIIEN